MNPSWPICFRLSDAHTCADGGGVRGLSALYILEQVMALVNEKNPDGPELKPYQVFDMIGATSTGE